MRGFFKLAFGVTILSLVALSAPGCGDDDDGGGKGGSGATGGGGTGGTTGDSGLTCGTNTCTGWKIGGIIPMNACCDGDKCGGDITASLGTLIGSFPVGCYGLDQPGKTDCSCPSYPFDSPINKDDAGNPLKVQFNGCCSTSGECGFAVDLSSEKGPTFGCIPLTKLGQTKVPCTVGSEVPAPLEDGGDEGYCPLPTTDGGTDGGGGTAGATGDAAAD